MGKTILDERIIKIIIREITRLCDENNVVNKILRNDVFALLESQSCTVLYYPLEDTIEGFRIKKYVNGRDEEFIYINTAKPEDIQIFTAAHELGHLINIDRLVCEELELTNVTKKIREDIIDRFAAELLMEIESFTKIFNVEIQEHLNEDGSVSGINLLRTIVFLMDCFMVPYASVVRRLYEIHMIEEDIRDYLLDKEVITDSLIEKVIEEGKYKRLKPTNIKSFGELFRYLEILDEAGEINSHRREVIMNTFGMKEIEIEIQDLSLVENIRLKKDVSDE